jgi:hypothetical protein
MMNITLITSFSYFLCWIARPYFVFRNIFRNYGRDTYDSVGTNRNAVDDRNIRANPNVPPYGYSL